MGARLMQRIHMILVIVDLRVDDMTANGGMLLRRWELLKQFGAVSAGALLLPVASLAQRQPVQVVAGTIYNPDRKGWTVMRDGAHVPLNIRAATQDEESIFIHFLKTFRQIHTFIAVPDETISVNGQGVSMGASVNTETAQIYIGRVFSGHLDPATIVEGNIWLYGLFS